MFAPGRILRVGGGGQSADRAHAAASAPRRVIDINSGTPVVTPVAPMPVGLHWANATVIAGRAGGGDRRQPGNNQLAGANYQRPDLEPATPASGPWAPGPPATAEHARLYHSIGHAAARRHDPGRRRRRQRTTVKGPAVNANAEIYYPPYLFTRGGPVRAAAADHPGARDPDRRHALRHHASTTRWRSPRDADQDRLGHPQLQHGAALHGAAVHPLGQPAPGERPGQPEPAPPRAATCCSCSTRKACRRSRASWPSPPPPIRRCCRPSTGCEYIASYPDLIRALGADAAAGAAPLPALRPSRRPRARQLQRPAVPRQLSPTCARIRQRSRCRHCSLHHLWLCQRAQ